MKVKKIFAYSIGILCAIGLICGLALVLSGKNPITVATAIIIICLSLCFGILFPNPISFWGLIAGICLLILPAWLAGLLIIAISIAGGVLNACIAPKKIRCC